MPALKFSAPRDWEKDFRWFDSVPAKMRKEFVQEYCTKIFELEGQACVVVTYPREEGYVVCYDLDGGGFVRTTTGAIKKARKIRTTEQSDFTSSAIMQSDRYRCEAEDIEYTIDDL